MNLTKQQRADLRNMFGGRCAYCGCELPEKGWHADHVTPVERKWWIKTKGPVPLFFPERDVYANLMPACRPCNLDKHASSLESWRKQLEDKVGVCRRNYNAFSHAERFGLVHVTEKPIVFWFERCSDVEQNKAVVVALRQGAHC